jgi:hypothetical protein
VRKPKVIKGGSVRLRSWRDRKAGWRAQTPGGEMTGTFPDSSGEESSSLAGKERKTDRSGPTRPERERRVQVAEAGRCGDACAARVQCRTEGGGGRRCG